MKESISWTCVLLGVIYFIKFGESANILCLSPFYITSHYNVFRNVFIELANRGHNVTVISAFKEDDVPSNYYHIQADQILPANAMFPDVEVNMFEIMKPKPFMIHIFLEFAKLRMYTETVLESKAIKEFVDNDNTKFDLIISEDFRFPPFFLLAHKYKAPLITYTTFGGAHWVEHYMGNPMNLQYVPQEVLDLTQEMNLWERLRNVVCSMWELLAKEFYFRPLNEKFSERFYEKLPQPLPKPTDIEKNVSLVFLNTHFSMDVVRSYLPNIVEVAGIHLQPLKKLPQDIKKKLDEAKDGVIYFSMGSILLGKLMPEDKIVTLNNVFGSLKQTILWKWEMDDMPHKARNVIIRKWFPQSDILGHPNVRLFITHGGLLSIQEAVYRGVPLVGIPIFADQPSNMKKAKHMGYAEYLDFENLNIEDTQNTIDKVLNDPKYMKTAKEISARVNDRPMTPMDTVMYWVEYVIRHKGAYHMKTPSSYMIWYEYYLLDVICVLTMGGSTFLAVIFLLFKYCLRSLFASPVKKRKSE